MARFYIAASDITDGVAQVRGTEFRHLQRVLRLREGDHVTLFDDTGTEHSGIVMSFSPRVAAVRVTASRVPRRESPLALTLYQGIPKGRKMDLVVEKATELGVHAIAPFTSAFSLGAGAGAATKRERWQRIAVSATKQSGRTSVPTIAEPAPFAAALATAHGNDVRLLFFEGANTVAFDAAPRPQRPPASAAVIVGPEGGFSRDEVDAACDAGFTIVDLGPRILRTETAAMIAVALVQARFGDLTGGRDAGA